MRAPQFIDDFLSWRWAPCALLTFGSLAYVGLAILIIPSPVDTPLARSQPSYLSSSFEHAAPPVSTGFGAALGDGQPAAARAELLPPDQRLEPSRPPALAPDLVASPPAPDAPSAP
jgi:hypothetical protein